MSKPRKTTKLSLREQLQKHWANEGVPVKIKPFRLLDLPAEIRLAILKELLWDSEPLLFRHARTHNSVHLDLGHWNLDLSAPLYPAVLQVCKQLHEEGTPVLYDNTLRCVIGCGSWDPKHKLKKRCDIRESMFGSSERTTPVPIHDLDWGGESPAGLTHKLQKFQLDVLVGEFPLLLDTPEILPRHMRNSIFRVAQFLDAHKQYKNLSFNLKFFKKSDVDPIYRASLTPDEFNEAYNTFISRAKDILLRPLIYLRGRSNVSVRGVSARLKDELSLCTTSRPIANLHHANARLRAQGEPMLKDDGYDDDDEYLSPEIPWHEWVRETLDECDDLCDEGRADEFLRAPAQIIAVLALGQMGPLRKAMILDDATVPDPFQDQKLRMAIDLDHVRAVFQGSVPEEVQELIDGYETISVEQIFGHGRLY